MTPFTLLEKLKNTGVDLWLEGDTLLYEGPADALTPDIMDTLKKMKPTLIQILRNDNCADCKQHEEIPGHGTGCIHTTKGNYQYQWSRLELLDRCPQGYWN